MATAVIGSGGLGSVIARHLVSGVDRRDRAIGPTRVGGDLHDLVVTPEEPQSLLRGH
jgi:hypothetical protein